MNQLFTTYGLTLPKGEVQPFVDIRDRMKGSAEWPRWVGSYVSSFHAMWGQPVVHELPLMAKPVLVIVGTVADVGHLIHLEAPARFREALLGFLDP